MISEIIDFAEHCFGKSGVAGTDYSRRERKNQVIVIKTKKDLSYDSAETFTDDKKLHAFLNLLNDLNVPKESNDFKNWLIRQNSLASINKRLGSTSGPMNSVPYVLSLSEKNLEEFEKKVKLMRDPSDGWKTKPELQSKLTKAVKSVYLSWWTSAGKTHTHPKNTLIFILLPIKIDGVERTYIYQSFENDRKQEWENPRFVTSSEEKCQVCGKSANLGYPFDFTYQAKKPFLTHKGRPDMDGIEFRICGECNAQYRSAFDSLQHAGFRLFPIFHGGMPRGLTFVNEDGGAKRFREIMEQMAKLSTLNKFDFQLVGMTNDGIWLYDYVSGYSLYLNKTQDLRYSRFYSRFHAEADMWRVFGIQKNYPYFDDNPEQLASRHARSRIAIMSIRERIFNFVYRGDDSALSREDISQATDYRIRELLLDDTITLNNANEILESAIRLSKVVGCKVMEVPKEDQENAELTGNVFRIILSKSKAKNPHELLGLALDKPRMDGVKSVLSRLLDRYHHTFVDLEKEDEKMISKALGAKYTVNRFDLLKIYFYKGYFEVNE
jgi:hypothetical protein